MIIIRNDALSVPTTMWLVRRMARRMSLPRNEWTCLPDSWRQWSVRCSSWVSAHSNTGSGRWQEKYIGKKVALNLMWGWQANKNEHNGVGLYLVTHKTEERNYRPFPKTQWSGTKYNKRIISWQVKVWQFLSKFKITLEGPRSPHKGSLTRHIKEKKGYQKKSTW